MIHAYMRLGRVGPVLEALLECGCFAISVIEVRGITPGLRREEYEYSLRLAQAFEPMTKLEIVGTDAAVAEWAELIAGTARTGALGDGMVFVTPVETAIRISTGTHGEAALPPPSTGGAEERP